MNITVLSGLYPPHSRGGGEVSTSLIVDGLRAHGHQVTVITNKELPGLTDKPLFEHRHTRRLANKLKSFEAIKADIVHAHDFRSGLVLAELIQMGAVTPKNAYVTLRDYAAISGDTNNILSDGSIPKNPFSLSTALRSYRVKEASLPRKVGRFLQYALNVRYRNKALSSIPNRVYISHEQQVILSPHLHTQQEIVIHNPVPSEYIQEPTKQKNGTHVVYLGRLETYKGVGLLLNAWQEVVKAIPNARLSCVGTGAQEEEYKLYVQDNNLEQSIEFRSHVPHEEIRKLYDDADVIVSPHLWVEPFGRTIIEGLARGCLIVAANHGGPKEVLNMAGCGFLFERGSKEGLTEALIKALQLPKEERDTRALQGTTFVKANLAPDIIAQEYEKLYQSQVRV